MPEFLSTAKISADYASRLKYNALKVLASGIAHDFNNLLTAIMGNISLAKMDIPEDDQLNQLLKEIEEASCAARDLTRQLEDYSHKSAKSASSGLINDIVDQTLKLYSGVSGIEIEANIPDNIKPVDIIEKQISEVVISLMSNARLSMPSGGKIKVEIKNLTIDENDKSAAPPGEYVMISIADRGCGISKENLTRIFDPYFTTRKKARGMGLAVAYSVVLNHNGFITVETEEGAGSSFSVYLPVSCE